MEGEVLWQALNLRVSCRPAREIINSETVFTVRYGGELTLRSRQSGDEVRLSGGAKSLKKLFIDRKIPAALRQAIPVVADETGIVGVYGIGPDWGRKADALPALQIRFENVDSSEKL
jgi:tRNA(Ile)-lysidine synthetase-like protein